MIKILKKATFLIASFGLSFTMFSGVSEASENQFYEINKEDAVYSESLGAYVTPLEKVDGTLIPMTKAEAIKKVEEIDNAEGTQTTNSEFNSFKDTQAENLLGDYYEYWKYDPTIQYYNLSTSAIKVSADINCTTPTCAKTYSVSVTVSASYSVTASAEKSAIKANAGFTWTTSASNSSSYRFDIVKGDRGYIAFSPKMNKTVGYLERWSNWDGYLYQKRAEAYSPVKLPTGEADGEYYFVYR
ncbi:hypothetical protein WAK64_08385 [Bacillus spongiae]|uniref:Toxin n=1 Tax=Bacillus spongiae TaxID=2683610 RepID=A0ABU8HDE4_9BACI